jgi:hypothetical protein
LTLPLEPLAEIHLEVIAGCLTRAWRELLAEYPDEVGSASEVELNALVCARLNNLDDRMWRGMVSSVVRDHSIPNFDGTHLQKSPDLSIHLTHRPPSFRLEVECKLIDHQNGKSVNLYLDEGLSRFVRGEYSWGVREALMIAYVRDNSTVSGTLVPPLKERMRENPDPYRTEYLPILIAENNSIARSSHSRSFAYISSTSESVPGPIAVWHVWL